MCNVPFPGALPSSSTQIVLSYLTFTTVPQNWGYSFHVIDWEVETLGWIICPRSGHLEEGGGRMKTWIVPPHVPVINNSLKFLFCFLWPASSWLSAHSLFWLFPLCQHLSTFNFYVQLPGWSNHGFRLWTHASIISTSNLVLLRSVRVCKQMPIW